MNTMKFGALSARHFLVQKRNLLRMLTQIPNKPNMDRIEQVGPDRACAEWLLRCGAKVKWTNNTSWLEDYNQLPSISIKNLLFEVEAIDSSIMDVGFIHLKGCNHIRSFLMNSCPYVEDNALSKLDSLKSSLQNLELVNLLGVTDEGIKSLTELTELKSLVLEGLPSVRYQSTFDSLRKALPNCDIKHKNVQLK
ncbi:DgyrCDS378 [Dimorphilus gyrociliatus]|uniref:DgyrCDS378 n=1 Tax=Dimorphilus gyrociliatus TaxID=2664684 RepID=A0A7I8V759_9ANNE|nr:DgyrCDS378 [Dimorphilus gyrociliatus]